MRLSQCSITGASYANRAAAWGSCGPALIEPSWRNHAALMANMFALSAPFALLLPLIGQSTGLLESRSAPAAPVVTSTQYSAPLSLPDPVSDAPLMCSAGDKGQHLMQYGDGQEPDREKPAPAAEQPDTVAMPAANTNPLNALRAGQTLQQFRVEQRVIIRISPRRRSEGGSLFMRPPTLPLNKRYEERKMANCVEVSGIGGVQTGSGTRLLLYLRDRRIVSVNLEKSCRARDFYSGFYVERNKDGKLCVARDKLQSRTGAKCEVSRMRQLVAVNK
ncbi:MAG: hypothetical protein AAF687_03175 [Pseudomonadota bacterium]